MIPGLREAVIESALVDLLQANAEGDWYKIDLATQGAKEALGFDPVKEHQDFLVSLEIPVYARTHEEAVNEFIKMVEEEPLKDWMYVVRLMDGTEERLIDGTEAEDFRG